MTPTRSPRPRNRARWLLLAAAVLLPGCAPPGTYSKVRSTIRDVVTRDLGPADRYDVDVSRDSISRLRDGRISDVKVHGVNVRTRIGVTLDEVFLSAHDVKVNRKTKRVESARDAAFTAYLGEKALATMLEKGNLVADPQIRITPDGVTVRGKYAMGPAPMNVVATGSVRVAGPTSVEFASKSVTVGGVPVPFPITRAMDISHIYEPLLLQGVTLEDGRAVLKGTIDWSKIP